jgi:MarR family transcriptional regulator, negative regulator of the multidrug operon emrRAB
MDKHSSSAFQGRDTFMKFVQARSPNADVNSVLLFVQFHRAHHLLEQAMEKNLDDVGLSWATFRVLMNLMRAEQDGPLAGLQPSELSEQQDISRNTMSALIGSLEKDELIRRELHGEDHRKFLIHLTVRGRELMQAQLAKQFEYVSDCFETMTARDRQQLLALLTRLDTGLSARVKPCKTDKSPAS